MKNTDYYLVFTVLYWDSISLCYSSPYFLIFFLLQQILIYSTSLNRPFTSALFLHTYVCSLFSFALCCFFSCFREDPRICILTGTFLTSHISGSAPNILLCKFVCVREIFYLSLLSGSFWWTAGFIPSSVRVPNEAFPRVFTCIFPSVTFAHNHEEHTWAMALLLWELKAVRLRSQLTAYDTRICF